MLAAQSLFMHENLFHEFLVVSNEMRCRAAAVLPGGLQVAMIVVA